MDRRTTLITAAAVTGTLLVGSAAVAANIGILSAAGEDNLGELSVTESIPTTTPAMNEDAPEPQVIDVYVEDPAITVATTQPAPSTTLDVNNVTDYAVDAAGTVSIERTDDGVLLNGAAPRFGWEWTTEQTSATSLTATFTRGETTFVFVAEVGPDGEVLARVDQPIVQVVRTPAPAPSPSPAPAPVPVAATPATTATPAPAPVPVGDDDDDDDQEDDDQQDDDQQDDDQQDDDQQDDDEQDDDDHEDDDDDHEGGEDDD